MTFTDKVRKVVAEIPRGQVMTYGEVAKRAGNPKAARAVGMIMSKNRDPKKVPCHRVIRSNGDLGGYAWGIDKKRKILQEEGYLKA